MQPGRSLQLQLQRNTLAHAPSDDDADTLPAKGAFPASGSELRLPVAAAPTPLYLFGAGHVGRAIARALHDLPFALHWYDSRAEAATASGAQQADEAAMQALLANAPGTAVVLILSHDHAQDYLLTRAALRAAPQFVGLIGSASKRARFLAQLRRDGLEETQLARLTCPIGLPGISGKEPAVIAIAVVAQLLAQRLG